MKVVEMKRFVVFLSVFEVLFALAATGFSQGVDTNRTSIKIQEISNGDGVPVLVKHLPDSEKVRAQATYANNIGTLKKSLGERPILDLIDFTAGTEAVTARYPEGQLLIIEYSNPQQSVEADNNFKSFLSQNNDGRTFYKRTGNYNILIFDASDEAAANSLISQVKYEKDIQWLGEDPFLFHRLERAFVNQTSDIFFSTVEVILLGIGLSILGGLVTGYIFFLVRDRQRGTFKQFSDAGGMTRLNLDGFTPDISDTKLLSD